jgi:hypothetical protein
MLSADKISSTFSCTRIASSAEGCGTPRTTLGYMAGAPHVGFPCGAFDFGFDFVRLSSFVSLSYELGFQSAKSIGTNPPAPFSYDKKLLHTHSPGFPTNPRFTGLACMYSSFSRIFLALYTLKS